MRYARYQTFGKGNKVSAAIRRACRNSVSDRFSPQQARTQQHNRVPVRRACNVHRDDHFRRKRDGASRKRAASDRADICHPIFCIVSVRHRDADIRDIVSPNGEKSAQSGRRFITDIHILTGD